MILTWGLPDDGPVVAVREQCDRLGRAKEFFLLDQSRYAEVRGDLQIQEGCLNGWLENINQRIGFDDLTGIYIRPYPPPRQADGRQAPADFIFAVDRLVLSLAEIVRPWTAVVNKPSAMASNDSKPTQSILIAACGFRTPETIVTNERQVAETFLDKHGIVVYKSISGIRSIVSTLTNGQRDRLERVATCPTQFQEFIPGEDYRVHVVAGQVFATRVVTDAVDYRYASRMGQKREMEAAELPEEVADRCVHMTDQLDLLVSGIDLRLTPEGEWYCFEVNTSPAFSWFEDQTGQPIASAVANVLLEGCRDR
jgi:glutathione synthase/RimK-type ligase-like ATP-grasp enzyme